MSNHLHGCKLSRDFAMDGDYTAFTFTSIFNLRIQCVPRGAVGFQGADGGIRPLVAASNQANLKKLSCFKFLFKIKRWLTVRH